MLAQTRAAAFLIRNLTDRAPGGEGRGFTESRQQSGSGAEYDLCEPGRPAKRTAVVVSGLTLSGERDHRLVNFCRALAESGIRVAAPALPGLKSYRFIPEDMELLTGLIRELNPDNAPGLAIIGFSVGGGIALAAAAESGDAVDLALVFGGHYDLGPVWREVVAKHSGATPESDLDWEDYIWTRMIMAYRDLPSLDLPEPERDEMVRLLGDYCDTEIGKKKEFFDRVMKPRPELCELRGEDDEAALARLSPRGKLKDYKGAVMVFHDPADLLVPPAEARKIYEELDARGPGSRQRVLVTPLLSHVSASATWRVFDVFPLLGMMGELFR